MTLVQADAYIKYIYILFYVKNICVNKTLGPGRVK